MAFRLRYKNVHKSAKKKGIAKDQAVSEHQDLNNILKKKNANIESIRVRYDFEQAAELAPTIKPTLKTGTTKNMAEKVSEDTFAIGAFAGILGTIVLHILSFLWEYLGLINITTMQISGEIFLNPSQINTFAGTAVSIIAHFIVGAVGGVLLAYFMEVSGYGFYWLKGLALAGFMLLAGMGLIVNIMGLAPQMRIDAVGVLFHMISYTAYGLVLSYTLYKLGSMEH